MRIKRNRLPASALRMIQGELEKVKYRSQTKFQSGRLFIQCPFHNEKTPSCMVTVSANSNYEVGSFRCMGCQERGDWNTLASALGLQTIDQHANVFKEVASYKENFYKQREQEQRSRYKKFDGLLAELKLENPKELPDKGVWRTLPHSYLKEVSIVSTVATSEDKMNEGAEFLLMPCYVKKKLVGGVKAVVKPTGRPKEIKYLNSPGEWSSELGLYPYDPVSKAMSQFEDEYGFRGLVLVEGARDSLCFNLEGMPTLATLGTGSWSDSKRDLILDLDPDFVLVCMDGDPPGEKAEEAIWGELKKYLPSRKMCLTRFSRVAKKKIDPGNAPKEVIDRVWETLHLRKPQR